jgi:GT2 family glycosyltransferase
MISKDHFEEIKGFNEHYFHHYQDVDLCLKLLTLGKRNIITPRAVLIHHESATRKSYYDFPDRYLLLDQWQDYIDAGDPYYNANFSLDRYDYAVRGE